MDQSSDNLHVDQTPPAEVVTMEGETNQAEGSGQNDDHKLFAVLGYILPFLFFIPLVQEESKNNPFARFHANQQLILLAFLIGLYLLQVIFSTVLFMLGILIVMLSPLVALALIVLVILGIINASQGKMKPLPLIGKLELLSVLKL